MNNQYFKVITGRTARYPHLVMIATFSGKVVSTFGKPIIKAHVEVNGKTTQTDDNGHFCISVPAGKPKAVNRFVMNVLKEGFGLISKVYNSGIQEGLWMMTEATVAVIDPAVDNTIRDTRRPNSCTGTLSSQVDWSRYAHRRIPRRVNSQGQYVGEASAKIKMAVEYVENANYCNNGISIVIPANSLVDSQGNAATEKVTVSLSTVDIYDPSPMPGDYTVDLGEGTGYMITYGAGTVTVTSRDKRYQLRKGAKATLTIPINPAQLKLTKKLEPNLPFLLYDEQKGTWHAVGEAKLDSERNAYVAEIDHFSAFNMDLVKTDQACVRIDSSGISEDYQLEITIPYAGDVIVKTVSVDNTPEKLHVIYNLPSNTDIALRAFKIVNNQVAPIADTITVSTGARQNPSTPNCPDYPYTACMSQVALTARSLAPVLYGPATASGTFILSWDYHWPGVYGSSQNGYQLEESTTSPASGFSPKHTTVNTGDMRTHVEYQITNPTGSYWYRVRARNMNVFTPCSNVVQVSVDTANTTATPTILKIINDLYDQEDAFGNWGSLNNIIRVRIGSTLNDVLYSTAGERLYPGESTNDPANVQMIPPAYGQNTSFREFDVRNIPLAADGTYWVFIQTGFWDIILDPNTFEFRYYQKKNTSVLNCNGQCCVEKWATVNISRPFYDPETIRVSDFLPYMNWMGHPSCT